MIRSLCHDFSREKLLAAYRLSKPVAFVVKALSWHKTIAPLSGSRHEEYAWIVPVGLKEFLVYEKMLSTLKGARFDDRT